MANNKDRRREPKDGEVAKLRQKIRRLESDKRKLIGELNTLTDAFDRNVQFLKRSTKDFTVEELIEAARKNRTLKQAEEKREHENTTISELTNKWACHTCNIGILKTIIYENRAGKFYFRCCNNRQCTNRTKPKPWEENRHGS